MSKKLIQKRFGPNAERYVTSEVHAKESSLQRLISQVNPKSHWNVLDVATATGHTGLSFASFSTMSSPVISHPRFAASHVAVLSDHYRPIPERFCLMDAASMLKSYLSFWSNIYLEAELNEEKCLLVRGSADSIRTTNNQLGYAFRAKIFTINRTADRGKICAYLGAKRAIDYQQEYIFETARSAANGFQIDINLLPNLRKKIIYTGSILRCRINQFKAEIARQLKLRVWPHYNTEILSPVIHKSYPLSDVVLAH